MEIRDIRNVPEFWQPHIKLKHLLQRPISYTDTEKSTSTAARIKKTRYIKPRFLRWSPTDRKL